MNNLSCFGSYDGDNSQCIRCNDKDCQKIEQMKMGSDLPKIPCWVDYEQKGIYIECPYEYEKDCRECEKLN